MRFQVYGLIDPRNSRVFYVGQTKALKQRLTQHSAGDLANPSYDTCLSIKKDGYRLSFCVFGEFGDRISAKRLERSLVLSIPDLTNSKAAKALLGQIQHPIGDEDRALLRRAMVVAPEIIPYTALIDIKRSHLGFGTRQP